MSLALMTAAALEYLQHDTADCASYSCTYTYLLMHAYTEQTQYQHVIECDFDVSLALGQAPCYGCVYAQLPWIDQTTSLLALQPLQACTDS